METPSPGLRDRKCQNFACYMQQIAGKCIFQCKLGYLVKAMSQSDLSIKMFFECKKLNLNNKNYSVKAIGLKLYYVIYSSATFFIVNLICLANIQTPDLISPRVEPHCQLFLLLVHCSYWKKTTHAMYYKRGGLCWRSTETKSADYCTYRWTGGISSYHSSNFFK